MEPTFLEQVKDDDVARMLFLLISPTRMEEAVDQMTAVHTTTDGRAIEIGVDVSTANIPCSDSSYSTERLLNQFMEALREESVTPVRQELCMRVSMLSKLSLQELESPNTVESNFSDKKYQLSIDEEDVLEFTEILERFNYQVPVDLQERCDAIVKNHNIPCKKWDGRRKSTFFAYAENNILMKICNDLSPLEVHEMYKKVGELACNHQSDAMEEPLNLPDVPLKALQEKVGLKDVAFYCFILSLMKKKRLNSVYTHELEFLLEHLQNEYEAKEKDHAHIDRALDNLNRYPLNSHPTGLCLIFAMTMNRPGAEKDIKLVKDLFEVFMYDVVVKVDSTSKDVEQAIIELQHPKYKFYDSLIVWVMAHGNLSKLELKDKWIDRREDFIHPITKIEWFHKKPKLFFIQACLVKEKDEFQAMTKMAYKDYKSELPAEDWWNEKYCKYTSFSSISHYANTLIAYATTWNKPAARTEEGSLYVDTLVDQFKRHSRKQSIESVLRRVHYNVNSVMLKSHVPGEGVVTWRQAPYFESFMLKEFILPPTPNQ